MKHELDRLLNYILLDPALIIFSYLTIDPYYGKQKLCKQLKNIFY